MALTIGGKITIGPGVTMTSQPYSMVSVNAGVSPYVLAYPWLPGSGFGTKYADPTVTPTSGVTNVAFSPNGRVIFLGGTVSPYIQAYSWTQESGFGTKYANPSTNPGAVVANIAVNPAGTVVAMSAGSTNVAYRWTDAGGFGTKYTDPAAQYGSNGSTSLAWSPVGDAIVTGGTLSNAPRVVGYKWSDVSGWGTAYAASFTSGGTANSIRQIAFNPAGTAVIFSLWGPVGTTSGPTVGLRWSSSTGWGTQYSVPANGSVSNGYGCCFTPDGSAVIYTASNSNGAVLKIGAYAWNDSTGFGTAYANATDSSTGIARISMLSDGTAFVSGDSAGVTVTEWNSTTGFGTRYFKAEGGTNAAITAVSTS